MAKRNAIVFIDGNNFYHCVKKINKSKNVSFRKLSRFICNHFNLILKEIYYYNSLPDISEGQKPYYDQMSFYANIKNEGINIRTRKLQKIFNTQLILNKHSEIDELGLCQNCINLIKNNCSVCIRPYKKHEKGIDVKIAVDMIRKCVVDCACDCVILISGDADFFSALDTIRNAGKEAISVSIQGREYSSKLRNSGFKFLALGRKELSNYYF